MKSNKIKNTDSTNQPNNQEFINPEFADLFAPSSGEAEIQSEARMIMYRFLSEIERVSKPKRGLKKRLAESINKSQSFITQLFNGDKIINLITLAKFQKTLGIKFKIIAYPESEFAFLGSEINESKESYNSLMLYQGITGRIVPMISSPMKSNPYSPNDNKMSHEG